MSGIVSAFDVDLFVRVHIGNAVREAAFSVENKEVIPALEERSMDKSLEAASKAFGFHMLADIVGTGFVDTMVQAELNSLAVNQQELLDSVESMRSRAVEQACRFETTLEPLYGGAAAEGFLKILDFSEELVSSALESLSGEIIDLFPIERPLAPTTCVQLIKYVKMDGLSRIANNGYVMFLGLAYTGELHGNTCYPLLQTAMSQYRALQNFSKSGFDLSGVHYTLRRMQQCDQFVPFEKKLREAFKPALYRAYQREFTGMGVISARQKIDAFTAAHTHAVEAVVEALGPLAQEIEAHTSL